MTKNRTIQNSHRYRLGSLGHVLLDSGISRNDIQKSGSERDAPRKDGSKGQEQSPTEIGTNSNGGHLPPSTDPKLISKPVKKTGRKKRESPASKARAIARAEEKKKLLAILNRQNRKKGRGDDIISTPLLGQALSPSNNERPIDPFSIDAIKQILYDISKDLTLLEEKYGEEAKSNSVDNFEIDQRMDASRRLATLTDSFGNQSKELVVGFDLGSTSSKIVLQFPYEASLGAFAVPAPASLQSDNHPYYWKSRIWVSQDGTFRLTPSDDAKVINHLKVAFLNSDQSSNVGTLPEQIHLTAFLALMIRQALGWLWQRIGRALTDCDIRISANFGYPSQSREWSPERSAFERCAKVALSLALSDRKITNQEILQLLDEEVAGRLEVTYPILVVPEFIGAVMGYFHSTQCKTGQYIICDFGGLTMDCVCFGFSRREDGTALLKIYGSSVQNFGAEIVKAALKQEIPKDKIATAIGNFICQPIIESFPKTGHNAHAWGGRMPLFVIGGGRHLGAYDNCFIEAQRLVKNAWFNTVFSKQDLDLDEEFSVEEANGRNCGRLLVAWGLSHSDLDLPEWISRDSLSDAPKMKRANLQNKVFGSEKT